MVGFLRGSTILRFGLRLIAIVFIAVAPFSEYRATQMFLDARAAANWPSVRGILNKAEVAETNVGRYRARVVYSYRVGDRDFAGSRVRVSDGEYNNPGDATRSIDGLFAHQPVSVFYNPSNPRDSLLHPGVGFQEWVLLFIPVVELGIGVGCLWLVRRSRPRVVAAPQS